MEPVTLTPVSLFFFLLLSLFLDSHYSFWNSFLSQNHHVHFLLKAFLHVMLCFWNILSTDLHSAFSVMSLRCLLHCHHPKSNPLNTCSLQPPFCVPFLSMTHDSMPVFSIICILIVYIILTCLLSVFPPECGPLYGTNCFVHTLFSEPSTKLVFINVC